MQGDMNASSTFVKTMRDLFHSELGKNIGVYIDDIFVFSDTSEKHFRSAKPFFLFLYVRCIGPTGHIGHKECRGVQGGIGHTGNTAHKGHTKGTGRTGRTGHT